MYCRICASCTYTDRGWGTEGTRLKNTTMSCVDDIFLWHCCRRCIRTHLCFHYKKKVVKCVPSDLDKWFEWSEHNPSWCLFTLVFSAVHMWSSHSRCIYDVEPQPLKNILTSKQTSSFLYNNPWNQAGKCKNNCFTSWSDYPAITE